MVNLQDQSCTCGEFQEHLIPCRRAVAVCLQQVHDPCEYVHKWNSIDYYRVTYVMHMQPVQEEDLMAKYSESEAPELTKQHRQHKKY